MIGTMERTNNPVESYVGGMTISGMLVIQTAIRPDGETIFQTQRILLSREAVQTLVPILAEYLGEL